MSALRAITELQRRSRQPDSDNPDCSIRVYFGDIVTIGRLVSLDTVGGYVEISRDDGGNVLIMLDHIQAVSPWQL